MASEPFQRVAGDKAQGHAPHDTAHDDRHRPITGQPKAHRAGRHPEEVSHPGVAHADHRHGRLEIGAAIDCRAIRLDDGSPLHSEPPSSERNRR